MDLDSLNFYIAALSTHRKAGKPDSVFLEKLKNLYLLDQVTVEVYEMIVEIVNKAAGKGKKTVSPARAAPSPSSYTSDSCGSSSTRSTRSNNRGCGDPEPPKSPTGSCGNHQSSSSNGRC